MKLTSKLLQAVGILTLVAFSDAAHAGYFEIAANGAYFKYSNGILGDVESTTISARWGASLAYRFLTNTSLELAYTQSKNTDHYGQLAYGISYDLTKTTQVQNTSLNLVLDLGDKKSAFRPYIRGGGGYMNRYIALTGTGTDVNGSSSSVDMTPSKGYSASADAGVGFKIFIADAIAIEISGSVFATDLDKPSNVYLHYSGTAGLKLLF